jgi:hypothetical protein
VLLVALGNAMYTSLAAYIDIVNDRLRGLNINKGSQVVSFAMVALGLTRQRCTGMVLEWQLVTILITYNGL